GRTSCLPRVWCEVRFRYLRTAGPCCSSPTIQSRAAIQCSPWSTGRINGLPLRRGRDGRSCSARDPDTARRVGYQRGGGAALLVRCPGLRVLGEGVDLNRQPSGSDVGEGHGLENRPLARPQCDPNLLQRLRRALVAEMLRPLAADAEQRTLDDPDDVGQRDPGWRLGEPIT